MSAARRALSARHPLARPVLIRPRRRLPVAALTAGGLAAALLSVGPLTGDAHAYVVERGDTLSQIARQHGVATTDLAEANGIADPDRVVAGATLVIPGTGGATTHVVRPGETLSGIAARYGVSTAALAEANGITDPDRIRSGATLAVSGSGASGQAAPAAPAAAPAARPGEDADDATVRRLITQAARDHGWRPAVPLGLAMQESGWNNTVTSSRGARGIMQVLPATGEWVGRHLLGRTLDLADPADNVAAGMAYLDYLYGRFDRDVELALAAYYEGPRRVQEQGMSDGARRYVANVLALAERLG